MEQHNETRHSKVLEMLEINVKNAFSECFKFSMKIGHFMLLDLIYTYVYIYYRIPSLKLEIIGPTCTITACC